MIETAICNIHNGLLSVEVCIFTSERYTVKQKVAFKQQRLFQRFRYKSQGDINILELSSTSKFPLKEKKWSFFQKDDAHSLQCSHGEGKTMFN